jgi:hypothetical protein
MADLSWAGSGTYTYPPLDEVDLSWAEGEAGYVGEVEPYESTTEFGAASYAAITTADTIGQIVQFGTKDLNQRGEAEGFSSTAVSDAYRPLPQWGQAPSSVFETTFGLASKTDLPPVPTINFLLWGLGSRTTAFGAHNSEAEITVAATGTELTIFGDPDRPIPPAVGDASGSALTSFGLAATSTEVSTAASSYVPPALATHRLRMEQPASSVMPETVFGAAGLTLTQRALMFRVGSYPPHFGSRGRLAQGFVSTTRFGSAIAVRPDIHPTWGFSRTIVPVPKKITPVPLHVGQGSGWGETVLGIADGKTLQLVQAVAPSSSFGTGLLRRDTVC